MSEQNQHDYSSTSERGAETLQEISDIKRIMERSSRFISLSGLSGIAAGVCALIGAYFADQILKEYYQEYNHEGYTDDHFASLKTKLVVVAAIVLLAALILAFVFTWRRARQNHLPVWDLTARKLLWNVLFPLVAGGLFVLAMLQYDEWHFVASACLVFYGLALVNGSKYTLSDVRYLGYSEIVLGLVSTQFIHSGLYFWAIGFGVLHIIYGAIMWWRHERVNSR
jgi:hypothetical protein